MRELADGDRGSFDVVFDGVAPVVRKVAGAMLSAADADDAVQHAMTKLFARASAFDVDGDVVRWAVELTVWEARTIIRRRGRENARNVSTEVRDSAGSPEDQAAHAEALRALEHVLGQVSDDDRAAVLGEGGDATHRKRKQRATARLKALWRKYYGQV